MHVRALFNAASLCLSLAITGCSGLRSADLHRRTGGSAALFEQFKAFDGHSGRPLSFEQCAAMARQADVVLFGEEHSDVVCNALEAQLLATLSQSPRPVSLAMEFFEVDVQTPLDAYLNGRLDEAEFRKLTRQKKAYLTSHRPLIEYCRAASIPVLAANAPWRLTRAYRTSGKDFDQFRATTQPADRALLPSTSELLTGPYHDRFVEAMSGHEMPSATTKPAGSPESQPASAPATSAPESEPKAAPDAAAASQPTTTAAESPASQPTSQPDQAEKLLRAYRAQSLWDDTMSKSIAEHRARYPSHRVMLIVGVFHVSSDGGTQVKLRRRRPKDTVLTIVYHGASTTPLKFDDADKGVGDIVIYGVKPPEDEEKPVKPGPTSAPTSAPTSMPTPTTQAM